MKKKIIWSLERLLTTNCFYCGLSKTCISALTNNFQPNSVTFPPAPMVISHGHCTLVGYHLCKTVPFTSFSIIENVNMGLKTTPPLVEQLWSQPAAQTELHFGRSIAIKGREYCANPTAKASFFFFPPQRIELTVSHYICESSKRPLGPDPEMRTSPLVELRLRDAQRKGP